jgi:hypoxanthine phosphoribosyltransferase
MNNKDLIINIKDYLPGNIELVKDDEYGTGKANTTQNKLYYFVKKQLNFWKPNYVIVIERKATAIIRALKESKHDKLELSWFNVISSEVLDQLPSDFFKNKKILIFDDMMLSGKHMEKILYLLYDNFDINPENIRVAVFGIHNLSSNLHHQKDFNFYYPHTWFCKDLKTSSFFNKRDNIVKLLKESGSLLLDTEHIEIKIKINNLFELIHALNRTGKTVVFNSNILNENKKNITVYYEDTWKILNPSKYPKGTILDKIVKKCRVIQRDIDEFAIIPIAYPAVSFDLGEWPDVDKIRGLFGKVSNNNKSAFYAIGLLGALDILKWTLKDLFASGFKKSDISIPKVDDKSSFALSHLRVIYPNLNLELLDKLLNDLLQEAYSEGRIRKLKKPTKDPFILKTNDYSLYEDAKFLIKVIRSEIDNKIIEKIINKERVKHPMGLRTEEIFNLANRIRINEPQKISALFDILIDDALLVTHVEKKYIDGSLYIVRTFEPDGEIISDVIRKSNDISGLNY